MVRDYVDVEIKNAATPQRIHKERPREMPLNEKGEMTIERLMYEALQDYAYHRWAASMVFNYLRPNQEVMQIVNHHAEKTEQARDRLRRYTKRLPPAYRYNS